MMNIEMNMEENELLLLIVFLNHHLMIISNVKKKKVQFYQKPNFVFIFFIDKLTIKNVSENADAISIDNKTSTKKLNYSTIENLEFEHISMEKLLRVCSFHFFFYFIVFNVLYCIRRVCYCLAPIRSIIAMLICMCRNIRYKNRTKKN